MTIILGFISVRVTFLHNNVNDNDNVTQFASIVIKFLTPSWPVI